MERKRRQSAIRDNSVSLATSHTRNLSDDTHTCNRLLNTFLSCSIDTSHQTVIEHDNLTEFLTPVSMAPSIFHQYTLIICNTLYSELLLKSLELMTRIVVYTNAITHSITRRRQRLVVSSDAKRDEDDEFRFMDKADTLALVNWGAERLEEEGRGVGVGMGFHRGVAKNVMHLLWALMAYGMVSITECGKLLKQKQSAGFGR